MIRVIALSALIILALANLHIPAALAAPQITLSSYSGAVGSRVDVDGSGFTGLLPVKLTFAGQPVNSTLPNIGGEFHAIFNVPKYPSRPATVMASNPLGESASATFIVLNSPPVAQQASVPTDEDAPVDILLEAADDNGDQLMFAIVTNPVSGALTGNLQSGVVTYTPNANFSGSDIFSFKANDGQADSNAATVSITVGAVNDPPVTGDQSVNINEDEMRSIVLAGSDPDSDPLTFSIVSGPAHGTLSGSAPNLVYDPADNYNGADSFTFKANDGKADSNTSTVSVSIAATGDAPAVYPANASTPEDLDVTLSLLASDVDSDSVSFAIASPAAHGSLGAVTPTNPMSAAVIYKPAANYYGSDSFSFKATDGTNESPAVTVSIAISAVNDAPALYDIQQTLDAGSKIIVALAGIDPDGDDLSFSIAKEPEKGILGQIVQTGPSSATVVYTPNDGQSGTDSFTFRAFDGSLASNVATASLTINVARPPPTPQPSPPTPEGSPPTSQSPKDNLVQARDSLFVSDSVLRDASIAPEPQSQAEHGTQITSGTREQGRPASFPILWLVLVIAGIAAAAFVVYRRLKKPVYKEPPSVAVRSPVLQETAVMKEAHRIFSMLGDERSKAARERVFGVAFGGAPADSSYERDRALLKEQFGQISKAVMSDHLLSAMFLDSFAEVAIKVWRALAKGSPGDSGLEPVVLLGTEAEKYWLEHEREPIIY